RELHHPTSYWLFPALLAMEAGIPLIWSAVGASAEIPEWGRDLLREVLDHSTYVSVRDDASCAVLRELKSRAEILNVPDTAFGVRDLCSDKKSKNAVPRYVAIQATPNLKANIQSVRSLVSWLTNQGIQVRSLTVAPALGDTPTVLEEIIGSQLVAE